MPARVRCPRLLRLDRQGDGRGAQGNCPATTRSSSPFPAAVQQQASLCRVFPGRHAAHRAVAHPGADRCRDRRAHRRRPMPWYAQALLVSQPLHFGDYGGLPLKLLWAVLDRLHDDHPRLRPLSLARQAPHPYSTRGCARSRAAAFRTSAKRRPHEEGPSSRDLRDTASSRLSASWARGRADRRRPARRRRRGPRCHTSIRGRLGHARPPNLIFSRL
jgi:hypothetical protein